MARKGRQGRVRPRLPLETRSRRLEQQIEPLPPPDAAVELLAQRGVDTAGPIGGRVLSAAPILVPAVQELQDRVEPRFEDLRAEDEHGPAPLVVPLIRLRFRQSHRTLRRASPHRLDGLRSVDGPLRLPTESTRSVHHRDSRQRIQDSQSPSGISRSSRAPTTRPTSPRSRRRASRCSRRPGSCSRRSGRRGRGPRPRSAGRGRAGSRGSWDRPRRARRRRW